MVWPCNLHLRKKTDCLFLSDTYSIGKLLQIGFIYLSLTYFWINAKEQDMNKIGWYAFCEHLFVLILNFAAIMSGVIFFYDARFHTSLEVFNLISIVVFHIIGLILDSKTVLQNSRSNLDNTPPTHRIINSSNGFTAVFQKFYMLFSGKLPVNDVLITFPMISIISQIVFTSIILINWFRRRNAPYFKQPEEQPLHVIDNDIPKHLPPVINDNIQLHGNAPNPPQGQNQPRLPASQVSLGHQHRPEAPISGRQHQPKALLGHQHQHPDPTNRKPRYAAASSQETWPISSLSQEARPSSSSSSKSRSTAASSRGSSVTIPLDKNANPAGFLVQNQQNAVSLNRQSSSVSMDKLSSFNAFKNQPFLSMGSFNRPSSMASLNRQSSSVTDMSQFSFVTPLKQAQRSAGNSNLISNVVETRNKEASSESDSSIKFEKSEEASLIKRNRSSTPSPEISSPEDNDQEEKLISQDNSLSRRIKNLSNELKTIICEMK